MYSHREEKRRVDVVDLDPYGTAAPFIDAAVQSVNDGGGSMFNTFRGCSDSPKDSCASHALICLCSQQRTIPKNGEQIHELFTHRSLQFKFLQLRWYTG